MLRILLAFGLALCSIGTLSGNVGAASDTETLAAVPTDADDAVVLAEGLAAYRADDFERAARLLYPLAVEGSTAAQMTIGDMYEEGAFFSHNTCLSLVWYDKAAREGHPKAMHYLANAYMLGDGVRRDPVKAVLWATAAAARGEAGARTVIQAMWVQMSDAEFAEAQHRQSTFRPDVAAPIELYPLPAQWAGDTEWLREMGLAPCHLRRFLEE